MKADARQIEAETQLGSIITARLDRLQRWPYPAVVICTVGVGYLIAFFDVTNVSFGLPVFSKALHFQADQTALPISAGLIGFVIGSWLNSNFADAAGRKAGIMTATLLFSAGCVITAVSVGLKSMVVGRFITGMGTGGEIAVVSAYVGEIAPAALRGRYIGMANIFAMTGQSIVPLVALCLVPHFEWGWRAMFLVGALGSLTLMAIPVLPESPRWLLSQQRVAEAAAVVAAAENFVGMLSCGVLQAPNEVAVEVPASGFPTTALLRAPFFGRAALLLAVWSTWYAGSYTWLGLGPTLFVVHGYTLTHTIAFLLMSSIGYPIGSVVATLLADRFERKNAIMAGLILWTASFTVMALVDSSSLIYIGVFLLSGALGFFLPLLYTLTAETFPTRARATGVALTEGAGHLGGAVGPVLATTIYGWGDIHSRFTAVFLFMALTGLLTAGLLPFTVSATRKSLDDRTK